MDYIKLIYLLSYFIISFILNFVFYHLFSRKIKFYCKQCGSENVVTVPGFLSSDQLQKLYSFVVSLRGSEND